MDSGDGILIGKVDGQRWFDSLGTEERRDRGSDIPGGCGGVTVLTAGVDGLAHIGVEAHSGVEREPTVVAVC